MSTAIVTKYSTANTTPESNQLLGGELAYSFASGNLFIGTDAGSYEVIGGSYYSNIVDRRSNTVSSGSLVERDLDGDIISRAFLSTITDGPGFIGNLQGVSDSANSIFTPVQIALTGNVTGNVVTNFANNVTIQVGLSSTGVNSGTYGNSTSIPVITVDSSGRITSASNLSISVASQQQSDAAFEKANLANVLAQAAFDAANSSTPAFNQTAFNHANAAFNTANNVIAASSYANSSFEIANLAIISSLASYRHANAAFAVANSDISASETANAAYNLASFISTSVNAAFNVANTALAESSNVANNFDALSNSVDELQSLSQNAAGLSISTNVTSILAYTQANAAFNTANTKLNITGGTVTGNLFVTGNLTVAGNVSYIATNHLNIGDNIITLNADLGQSATPTENAGIEVERGASPNVSIIWNETLGSWTFTNDGTTFDNLGSGSASSYANSAFDLSNSVFSISTQNGLGIASAYRHANAGFNFANTANNHANTAYAHANAAYIQANTPSQHANSAYIHANAAFATANALNPSFNQSAFDRANAAFQSSNNVANVVGSYANSSFDRANAAFAFANTISLGATDIYARTHANAAFANSNAIFNFANSSYLQANLSTIIALAAYATANSVDLGTGQGAWDTANASYAFANSTFIHANAAFTFANVLSTTTIDFYARPHVNAAFNVANSSFLHANAAFGVANTKFNSSGGTISGDVTLNGNLTIQGSSVLVSVPTLSVEDNIIDISSETIGTPTQNAGIRVIRGDEVPVQFRWNESLLKWTFTNDGINYSSVGSDASEQYANASYSHANAAFGSQNTTGVYANSAYLSQNTTGVYANAAYAHANTKFASAGGTISGDVLVSGNLTIVGQTIYANTETVVIKDNIITLNAAINQAASPQFNAGFEVDRGSSSNVSFIWNETVDNWQYTVDGSNFVNLSSASAESYANSAFLAQNTTASYANSAYTQANIAYNTGVTSGVYANAAYSLANTLVTAAIDSYARPHVNAAFNHANSSFDLANTASQRSISGESYANGAFSAANTADQKSVIAGSYANSAYSLANTVSGSVTTADQKASSAGDYANSSFVRANTADQRAVTSGTYANAAYTQANTATTNASTADQKAVTSGSYANAAYTLANTRYSSSGGTISGDVTVTGNITVQGNTAYFSVPHFISQDGILEVNVEQIGGNPTENAGLRAMRGDLNPTVLLWNESTDSWSFTNDGTNYSNIASSSAEVYANAAFRTQNTTAVYANSAFDVANTALTAGGTIAGGYANSAFAAANSASSYANSAYTNANTKFASAGGTISGDVRVTGRLTVDGQLNSHSPFIQLNSDIDQDASPSENAGLRLDRGISPNVSILWNEGDDRWSFTNDGSNFSYVGSAASESYANSGFSVANTADQRALTSGSYANSAYVSQNTTGVYANTAYLHANASYESQNTTGVYANAAFTRANSSITSSGGTISGDLVISGNLTVVGNATTINVSTLIIDDALIQLAANNETSDALDIGFVGHYSNDSGINKRHTGIFRDATDGLYYLFYNYLDPSFDTASPNNTIDVANSSFRVANLNANIVSDVVRVRGYDPVNHANSVYAHANASYIAANTAIADALAFAIALG